MARKSGGDSKTQQQDGVNQYKIGDNLDFTYLGDTERGIIIQIKDDKIKVKLDRGIIVDVAITKNESKFFYIN